MRPPLFIARVTDDGKHLKFENSPRFLEYLRQFKGQRVEVMVREKTKIRSYNANDYYWGVVLARFSKFSGYETKEEMHEILKKEFNVKTTSSMKTPEFQEYIAKVIRLAAKQGCNIPDPDGVYLG